MNVEGGLCEPQMFYFGERGACSFITLVPVAALRSLTFVDVRCSYGYTDDEFAGEERVAQQYGALDPELMSSFIVRLWVSNVCIYSIIFLLFSFIRLV